MLIRKADEKDVIKAAKIYDAIHSAEAEGKLRTGWIKNIYPVLSTAKKAQAEGCLFVGEVDEEVKGAAIINQIQHDSYSKGTWKYVAAPESVMVLHTLVIKPEAAGRGFGLAFVHFYAEYALKNSCEYLRLDTNAINKNARAFYAKIGFKQAGIVETPFNGLTNVNLVLLEAKARQILLM